MRRRERGLHTRSFQLVQAGKRAGYLGRARARCNGALNRNAQDAYLRRNFFERTPASFGNAERDSFLRALQEFAKKNNLPFSVSRKAASKGRRR